MSVTKLTDLDWSDTASGQAAWVNDDDARALDAGLQGQALLWEGYRTFQEGEIEVDRFGVFAYPGALKKDVERVAKDENALEDLGDPVWIASNVPAPLDPEAA
jgi:hypothetical protein